jgi:hypothetical protein
VTEAEALARVAELEAAIRAHRDAVCNDERADWLEGIDIDLWLALRER